MRHWHRSRRLNGRGRRLALAGAAPGPRRRGTSEDGGNTAIANALTSESRIIVFQHTENCSLISSPFGAAPCRRVSGPLEASAACLRSGHQPVRLLRGLVLRAPRT